MDYQSLLVWGSETLSATRTLDTAAAAAARFDAHLTGIFLEDPSLYRYPLAYQADLAGFPDRSDGSDVRTHAARTVFDKACRKAGIDKTGWRCAQGKAIDSLTVQARYADAIFMTQATANDGVDRWRADVDLPAKLAIASARPVIAVPENGSRTIIDERILIGWKASREATRAVTAALPLLRRAYKVKLIAIDPAPVDEEDASEAGADIALYLARHGVNVETREIESDFYSVTDVLLDEATAMDADLICIGAYGYSRLRELIMGGVTRELMRAMSIPVLLAH